MGLSVTIKDSPNGALLIDATPFARQLRFSTNRHGFADCSLFIPRNIYDGFYLYDRPGLPHLVVSWNGATVWEGRVEDVAVTDEGVRIGAFGYWRSLMATKKYTALWSSTRTDSWKVLNSADYSPAASEKFETSSSNDNEIYIGLKKNEFYSTASDAGVIGFALPHRGLRNMTTVELDYVVSVASQFSVKLLSFTQNYWAGTSTSEWGVTGSGTGASQSGSAIVTLTGSTPNSLAFYLSASAANASYLGETGDQFVRITNIRVSSASTNAPSAIYSDEIIGHVVSFAASANASQINNTTGLIQSPAVDLKDEVYQDANPADILDQLSLLGDGTERWEVGVWEGRNVHFRARASEGRAWYVDVSSIDLERTLAQLRNSAYAIYTDANGKPRRTAATTDDYSILRYGVTQEDAISVETTDTTSVGLQVDALLDDKGDPVPRATLEFKNVFDRNGIPWPPFMVRSGDTITIRNLMPALSSDVDRIRTFRIAESEYNADTGILSPTPESTPPTIDAQIAGTALGSAGGGQSVRPNTKFGKTNTDTISGGAVILDAGSDVFDQAQFLVLEAHTGLAQERVWTTGSGLSSSDAGAGLAYTVALGIPSSIESNSTNSTSGSSHTHAAASTLARSGESYVVLGTSTSLTAERVLVSGSGLTYADAGANSTVTIGMGTPSSIESNSTNSTSGSSHTHAAASTLARSGESYVVLATSTSLTAERVLTTGSGLTYADAGANGAVTIGMGAPTSVTDTSTNSTTGSGHTHAFTSPSTLARSTESYVVLATSSSLSAERVLTTGSGLTYTDAGANGAVTLGVGSGSGMTVTGSTVAIATPGVMSYVSGNNSTGATASVPTLVSGTAVSTTSGSTALNVTIDASAVAGHKLFLVVATRGNSASVTTPAGWYQEGNAAQTNITMTVLTRIARDGDAGATVTLAFSASVNAAAVVVRSPDAVAGEFVNVDGSNTNAASTSVTVNSITTTINNCLIMMVSTWGSAATMTVDATTTELVEKLSTDSGNNVGLNVAYYTQATSGSTGNKTNTLTSSAGTAVGQFAIIPANSGGHQHYIGATYRPGAAAVLCSNGTGGLNLAYLNVGDAQSTTLSTLNVSRTIPTGSGMADIVMPMELPSETDNSFVSFSLYRNGGDGAPVFVGRSARGSRTSPTATQADDQLAIFSGRGYGATGFSSLNRGAMTIRAVENWTDSAQGALLAFYTTASGTTSVTEKMILSNGGDLGIGVTSPKGRLHGYNTIGGFIYWEYDGVDTTARIVIPNGTGDVAYRFQAVYVVRDSGGGVSSGTANISVSGNSDIYTDGTDTLNLRVNADGSVDVRRTAGSATFKVAMWCVWI